MCFGVDHEADTAATLYFNKNEELGLIWGKSHCVPGALHGELRGNPKGLVGKSKAKDRTRGNCKGSLVLRGFVS